MAKKSRTTKRKRTAKKAARPHVPFVGILRRLYKSDPQTTYEQADAKLKERGYNKLTRDAFEHYKAQFQNAAGPTPVEFPERHYAICRLTDDGLLELESCTTNIYVGKTQNHRLMRKLVQGVKRRLSVSWEESDFPLVATPTEWLLALECKSDHEMVNGFEDGEGKALRRTVAIEAYGAAEEVLELATYGKRKPVMFGLRNLGLTDGEVSVGTSWGIAYVYAFKRPAELASVFLNSLYSTHEALYTVGQRQIVAYMEDALAAITPAEGSTGATADYEREIAEVPADRLAKLIAPIAKRLVSEGIELPAVAENALAEATFEYSSACEQVIALVKKAHGDERVLLAYDESTVDLKAVGERLKASRLAARLTQVEAAKVTGHDQAIISKHETGTGGDMKINTLIGYARAYGVAVSSLIPGKKDA